LFFKSSAWTIGYFTSDTADPMNDNNSALDYSVVPISWLVYKSAIDVMCKWPNKKSINVSNLVKRNINLTKDYSLHNFKLVNDKHYGKYINIIYLYIYMFFIPIMYDTLIYPYRAYRW